MQPSPVSNKGMLRRTSWIWAVGSAVWFVDGMISAVRHNAPYAELNFLMAALFFIAWMFYRTFSAKK